MKTSAPISFAGSQLAETCHVCALFNSEDEEYRVLLPFIEGEIDCRHKAVNVDGNTFDAHRVSALSFCQRRAL